MWLLLTTFAVENYHIITNMYKKLLLSVAVVAACMPTKAQTSMATDYKGSGNNNPISANVFCADPTALEYNGRLYVYGSNDHQEFLANGKKGDNSYGNIKSIVVFSTDDMVNWTFHGTIDTKKICAGWQPSGWPIKGYGVSWAPSVIWRTHKRSKKDEFFLYFCNNVHGIGVLKAASPIGPWESPLDQLMIHSETPGAKPSSAIFDPGVTIDANGVGWLAIGGLDPVAEEGGTGMDTKNARVYKLNYGMISVDGLPTKIPAPYHFEANELNVINGKYVYTYCTNWSNRSETASEWNAYKAAKGITGSAPDPCQMCYMVSDDLTNPDSWVYKGIYGPHPQNGTNNNHSHLQKFQGNYYYIFHNAALKEKMKSAGAIDGSAGIYRSICVNKVTVDESTATISQAPTSLTGVEQIKKMNPYELQQMETMASCGGVEYEDFTNIRSNTQVSGLNNDASENMQVKMKAGSWINVRKVDFGTAGAAKFMLRARGIGKIEIRTGNSSRNIVATIEFSSTEMTDQSIDIPIGKLKDVKNNIYLFVSEATDFYVDAWQFTEYDPTGIQEMSNKQSSNSKFYDLMGRKLLNANNHRGIVIEHYTDENGVKHSRKVLAD